MWTIKNRTPYRAAGSWGRDRNGAHEWLVAVKGTFDIRPDGGVAIADEQLEPLLAPEYNGDAGLSSLRYDADLVAQKPTTDILLNGTAYAPNGKPSTAFGVALRVGAVHKAIKVNGHRRRSGGPFGSAWATEPIERLEVLYEHAYGGFDAKDADPRNHRMDARNPVGRGLETHDGRCIGQALPNFEYPGGSVEKTGPAGFGAIDSYWSPRRELSGTYDESWLRGRLPLLPIDWSDRSLLCAPVDQRSATHLLGGERVELTNLTPNGRMNFVLPSVDLTFSTRIDTRSEDHRAKLSTVIIEPDRSRVVLVWLTSLQCPTDVDYLEETVVHEAFRRP